MNPVIDIGDPVRITAGPYTGTEGIVEDLQPQCDAVRVRTDEGIAYSFLEGAVRIPKALKSKSPIRKR
jgi:ribosomal protein L24